MQQMTNGWWAQSFSLLDLDAKRPSGHVVCVCVNPSCSGPDMKSVEATGNRLHRFQRKAFHVPLCSRVAPN